jgi:hypothetical protein
VTPERLVAAIAPVVREYVERAVKRLEQLEAAVAAVPAAPAGPPGPAGAPGTDGRDGARGRDGVDGVGIDDVSVVYDGERTITLTVTRSGGFFKAFPITLPIPLDRGGWSAARIYSRGDLVSYHGNAWICQGDSAGAKPGTGSQWRLAIRGMSERALEAAGHGGTSHD